MQHRLRACALLLVLPCLATPGLCDGRKSLHGLQGVAVHVSVDVPAAIREYCDSVTIQTRTELKLRQYGVRILSDDEEFLVPGKPSLYVSLLGVSSSEGTLYAISVRVVVNQFLLREPKLTPSAVFADTWSSASVLMYGTETVKGGKVYETVADQCDEFVNDWLAEHGK